MRLLRVGSGVSGSLVALSRAPHSAFYGQEDNAEYPHPGVTPGHHEIRTPARTSYRNSRQFPIGGVGA